MFTSLLMEEMSVYQYLFVLEDILFRADFIAISIGCRASMEVVLHVLTQMTTLY